MKTECFPGNFGQLKNLLIKSKMSLELNLKLNFVLLTFLIIVQNLACSPRANPPATADTPVLAYSEPGENHSMDIKLANGEGTFLRQLTHSDSARNWFPAWSPDGKQIAYSSDRGSNREAYGIDISRDYSVIKLTSEEMAAPDFPERKLAPMVRGTGQVWIMNADGSNQRQLTFDGRNASPAWSPDGKTIAFNSTRTGICEIWLMDADGSNQRQITFNQPEEPGPFDNFIKIELHMHGLYSPEATGPINVFPTWSPDGKKIAFCSIRKDSYAIWVMDSDGKNLSMLTRPENHEHPQSNCPSWSPKGDKIAYFHGINVGPGSIWVINADGSNPRQVSDEPEGAICDEPSWSADGSKILYSSTRRDVRNGVQSAVWIANPDGTEQRPFIKDCIPGFNRTSWRPLSAPPWEEEPRYIIFSSGPDRGVKLPEQIGMKGDGKNRYLGFLDVIYTFEAEDDIEKRIRHSFATARENDLAVMFLYDFHYFWKNRPDLWNWFDPDSAGYDPQNKMNVEWHGWDGPPNKVRYLNWGVPWRLPPHLSYTSEKVRSEITRMVREVIVPVTLEELAKLKKEGKEDLFAGILVGSEPSIDDYTEASAARSKMMEEDGVKPGPLGYRALLDRGYSADNPPENFRHALAEIIQETIAFWCKQFVDGGLPAEKLYPHVAAPAPIEMMNAPIWTAFNEYSRPGWTTYPVMVLGQNFKAVYRQLEKNGNPRWAGTEAGANFPGSAVEWETYLGWHFNHGATLMIINYGASSEDLTDLLLGCFREEAVAAYQKFFKGIPLEEKEISSDHPQFRVQRKMKKVRETVQWWHTGGKDPSEVEKLVQGVQPLMNQNKPEEAEKILDQALEMLGVTETLPEVYGQDKDQ